MASVSSASRQMTALPAKIRSAARVRSAAMTGMGRTATAWVTPTSTTSISIIRASVSLCFGLNCIFSMCIS
jgi:hypothetical protein